MYQANAKLCLAVLGEGSTQEMAAVPSAVTLKPHNSVYPSVSLAPPELDRSFLTKTSIQAQAGCHRNSLRPRALWDGWGLREELVEFSMLM